jgi:hypothetical protein
VVEGFRTLYGHDGNSARDPAKTLGAAIGIIELLNEQVKVSECTSVHRPKSNAKSSNGIRQKFLYGLINDVDLTDSSTIWKLSFRFF